MQAVHTAVLDFRGNKVGPNGVQALAGLKDAAALHTLTLNHRDNNLGPSGAPYRAEGCRCTAHFDLESYGQQSGDSGVQALARLKDATADSEFEPYRQQPGPQCRLWEYELFHNGGGLGRWVSGSNPAPRRRLYLKGVLGHHACRVQFVLIQRYIPGCVFHFLCMWAPCQSSFVAQTSTFGN